MKVKTKVKAGKCDKVCKNKCDHWYSDCDISNMRCVRQYERCIKDCGCL